ncbi:hypothetical protein EV586_103522 [Tumebacillus sp. BK434]|uniref:hypothetical protein n=1 Tax=Tumebacillus sp. BK434 TaxID=2512169 RepID=UPI001047D8A4|nr:hypothetical protein [Tumebacillus sp. BK434]TCP55863.1 hypothetical protein EV586_103522 [Tumebacillus sp. BK434]
MLTFTSFLLISLVLFGAFYAWYWYVHRNGVYNAAKADRGDTLANLEGTDRYRPTSSPGNPNRFAMTEFGEIGQQEDETGSKQQQQRPITDPHRLLPAPHLQSRLSGMDTEFSELPSAKFEQLPDQLPVVDDTVEFRQQQNSMQSQRDSR